MYCVYRGRAHTYSHHLPPINSYEEQVRYFLYSAQLHTKLSTTPTLYCKHHTNLKSRRGRARLFSPTDHQRGGWPQVNQPKGPQSHRPKRLRKLQLQLKSLNDITHHYIQTLQQLHSSSNCHRTPAAAHTPITPQPAAKALGTGPPPCP